MEWNSFGKVLLGAEPEKWHVRVLSAHPKIYTESDIPDSGMFYGDLIDVDLKNDIRNDFYNFFEWAIDDNTLFFLCSSDFNYHDKNAESKSNFFEIDFYISGKKNNTSFIKEINSGFLEERRLLSFYIQKLASICILNYDMTAILISKNKIEIPIEFKKIYLFDN